MAENWKQYGAVVAISPDVLVEGTAFQRALEREMNAAMAVIAESYGISAGTLYGPPRPKPEYIEPEVEVCEHCGHVLDDWDD